MVNLYLLPIVLVAMTLGGRGATVIFAGVALAWLSVLVGEGPLPPPATLFARLFGELGPYALVAYLTQALAGTITSARRRIEEMAERDGLTGMLNLRTFRAVLNREHELRARAGRGGYGILLVDMDDLKQLNDEHGHQAGNRAITSVAGAIQRAIRTTDMAARYGGDEFIVFLAGADKDIANDVAQRIRNVVFATTLEVDVKIVRIKVNVGAASFPEHGGNLQAVTATADRNMYKDKELREPPKGKLIIQKR
jgi:diguanylate cyclase (GGDEF)-like protein